MRPGILAHSGNFLPGTNNQNEIASRLAEHGGRNWLARSLLMSCPHNRDRCVDVTLANGKFDRTRSVHDRVFRLPSAGQGMSKTTSQAPASVAENVEKVIRVENETLRPRSRSEAVTDAVGGFVGTMSFVVAQLVLFAAWIIVNA